MCCHLKKNKPSASPSRKFPLYRVCVWGGGGGGGGLEANRRYGSKNMPPFCVRVCLSRLKPPNGRDVTNRAKTRIAQSENNVSPFATVEGVEN